MDIYKSLNTILLTELPPPPSLSKVLEGPGELRDRSCGCTFQEPISKTSLWIQQCCRNGESEDLDHKSSWLPRWAVKLSKLGCLLAFSMCFSIIALSLLPATTVSCLMKAYESTFLKATTGPWLRPLCCCGSGTEQCIKQSRASWHLFCHTPPHPHLPDYHLLLVLIKPLLRCHSFMILWDHVNVCNVVFGCT